MPPPPGGRRSTTARAVIGSALISAGLVVASCASGGDPATAPTTGGQTTTTPSPSSLVEADSTAPTTTDSTSSPGGDQVAESCRPVAVSSAGQVERDDLVETSGLAASQTNDGIFWAHNDSGQVAGVYAIDLEGADHGFFALVDDDGPVPAEDIEDMALSDGILYLADIGDNSRKRASVRVYTIDEPTPGQDGTVAVTGTIEITYPDGPTDAEALLVDRAAGELLILSKFFDQPAAPTRLYAVPLAAFDDSPGPIEASLVGEVDVAALSARSGGFSLEGLLLPGLVTGADLAPGGDLIVLRTYGSAWLFPRRADQTLAQALTQPDPGLPCEGGAATEAQGEAVALLPVDRDREGPALVRYVTVSEGRHRDVNLVEVEVDLGP